MSDNTRCATCGRLKTGFAPSWAFHCLCDGDPSGRSDMDPEIALQAADDKRDNEREDMELATHPCTGCVEHSGKVDCVHFFSATPLSCPKLAAFAETLPMDAMVAAIRADKLVGDGSCSSIDESMDDADIISGLVVNNVRSAKEAVRWARVEEQLWLERGLNTRWGEDDDPQLKAYREFKAADKENL